MSGATLDPPGGQGSTQGLHAWLVGQVEKGSDEDRERAFEDVLRRDGDGELDLLHLLLGRDNLWSLKPDFETRNELYTCLVPRLRTTAARLVAAVRGVTEDVWQHSLDDVFRLWCEAEPQRPDEVLLLAAAGEPLEDRFLLPALVAGYKLEPRRFFSLAIEAAQGRGPGSRTGGIYSLGAMPLADGPHEGEALRALADVIAGAETDGVTRSAGLFAAVRIISRADGRHADLAMEIAATAAGDTAPEMVRQCAMAVASPAAQLPPDVRRALARSFAHVDATSVEALHPVDLALDRMLRLGDEEDALRHTARIVASGPDSVAFGSLDSVASELSRGDRGRLGRLLVRWLATGKPILCAAARHLVMQSNDQRLACDRDLETADLPGDERSFVARKAVGWLMPHPTAPASIAVGLLRDADDGSAATLASLLLDPLLVNYPLAAKDYLEAVLPGLPERAARWVGMALSEHASYLAGIEATGLIRELQPGRRHSRLAARHLNADYRTISREARAKSPLLSMTGRSTVLYGRRTISRITDHDGTERRLVNEMKSVSTVMDRVMGLTYDPDGLDFLLMRFRSEVRPP